MHARTDVHTPFHIDLDWWRERGRNFDRFLSEILDGEELESSGDALLDYIDNQTGEVFQLAPLWAQVLTRCAHRPGYITSTTPLTNALLRALIENRNQPMTAVELQRRISRSTPEALLRLMRTARQQYGIVPA